MTDTHSSRRAFLRRAVLASGGAWLAGGLEPVLAAAAVASASDGDWQVLTTHEILVLEGVADTIWPPDDTPGGAALGVVRFMDAALAGFMAGALPTIRAGISDLDEGARRIGADDFPVLAPAHRTEVLAKFENTPFFGTARFMTLCGLFALPSWGGNRGGEGWTALGFENRHAWAPPFGAYDAAYAQENGHDD